MPRKKKEFPVTATPLVTEEQLVALLEDKTKKLYITKIQPRNVNGKATYRAQRRISKKGFQYKNLNLYQCDNLFDAVVAHDYFLIQTVGAAKALEMGLNISNGYFECKEIRDLLALPFVPEVNPYETDDWVPKPEAKPTTDERQGAPSSALEPPTSTAAPPSPAKRPKPAVAVADPKPPAAANPKAAPAPAAKGGGLMISLANFGERVKEVLGAAMTPAMAKGGEAEVVIDLTGHSPLPTGADPPPPEPLAMNSESPQKRKRAARPTIKAAELRGGEAVDAPGPEEAPPASKRRKTVVRAPRAPVRDQPVRETKAREGKVAYYGFDVGTKNSAGSHEWETKVGEGDELENKAKFHTSNNTQHSMYCVAERASPSDAFRVYFVSSEGVLQQRAAEGVERHISPVRVPKYMHELRVNVRDEDLARINQDLAHGLTDPTAPRLLMKMDAESLPVMVFEFTDNAGKRQSLPFSPFEAQQVNLCSLMSQKLTFQAFCHMHAQGMSALVIGLTIPNQCSPIDYRNTYEMARGCLNFFKHRAQLSSFQNLDVDEDGDPMDTDECQELRRYMAKMCDEAEIMVQAEGHATFIASMGNPRLKDTFHSMHSLDRVPIITVDCGGGTCNVSLYVVLRKKDMISNLETYRVRTLAVDGFMGGGFRFDKMAAEAYDLKPEDDWAWKKERTIGTQGNWKLYAATQAFAEYDQDLRGCIQRVFKSSAYALRQAKDATVTAILTGQSLSATALSKYFEGVLREELATVDAALVLKTERHTDKSTNASGMILLGKQKMGRRVTLGGLAIDLDLKPKLDSFKVFIHPNEKEDGNVLAAGASGRGQGECALEELMSEMVSRGMLNPQTPVNTLEDLFQELPEQKNHLNTYGYYEPVLGELLNLLSETPTSEPAAMRARRAALTLAKRPATPAALDPKCMDLVWAKVGLPFHLDIQTRVNEESGKLGTELVVEEKEELIRISFYNGLLQDEPGTADFRGALYGTIEEKLPFGEYEVSSTFNERGDIVLNVARIKGAMRSSVPSSMENKGKLKRSSTVRNHHSKYVMALRGHLDRVQRTTGDSIIDARRAVEELARHLRLHPNERMADIESVM